MSRAGRTVATSAATIDSVDVDVFVGYVGKFYQTDGFWRCTGTRRPTEEEVRSATAVVLAHYREVDRYNPLGPSDDLEDVELSSHAREVVRDIILMRRGYPLQDLEWRVLLEIFAMRRPVLDGVGAAAVDVGRGAA